jgi:hypothetical protein
VKRKPDKPDLSELKTMSAKAGAAAVQPPDAPVAVRVNAAGGANRASEPDRDV